LIALANRIWRVGVTGFSFALFGFGGLVFTLLVIPVLKRLPGDATEREFRCQYAVHKSFGWFVRVMEVLGLLTVEVRNAERLREPGQLIVANHPTLLDVVFLVAQLPQADCVVKQAVMSNPFMRGTAVCAGFLANDPGDALVDACAARLARNRSLLLFPEGTRTDDGRLGEFRRGAAHVALRSGRPLRPVVIHCHPPSLMRGQRWYQVPHRKMRIVLECCEPISPEEAPREGALGRGAVARRLSARLRDFYAKRLQNLDSRGS
jgi:1-acyl-sn-glycerol-3-phosphate acyltransferase